MKKTLQIFLLIVSTILITNCSNSTSPTSSLKTSDSVENDYSSYTNLADVLRHVNGVTVTGSGTTVKVEVIGIANLPDVFSYNLPNRFEAALYVYDGLVIGRDYNKANSMIKPASISSIEVISDPSRLAQYGGKGNDGVILIGKKQ